MKTMSLGLKEALQMTLERIRPLPPETVPLVDSVDRVVASDIIAQVDSPSVNASLKDGYALFSPDSARATAQSPVGLRLSGTMFAGGEKDIHVTPGTTVRVLTGARIPMGADAVVAEEYVTVEGGHVRIDNPVESGRNILPQGIDVAREALVIGAGRQISPGMAGLLAAAGHGVAPVHRKPVVGVIGTGDEIVAPGNPLVEGKLYASNITTLAGWCGRYGMKTRMSIVKDDYDLIMAAIRSMSEETDVLITSGGAWTGEHDIVVHVLNGLGWHGVFHRIRIGPGKAVGFGLLDQKPVFILPGGPPSNLMAFLQVALPGLLALSGHRDQGLPRITAILGSEIRGKDPGWTDFFYGTLQPSDKLPTFYPLKNRSRLSSMADATAVAAVPEGQKYLSAGTVISIQLLS